MHSLALSFAKTPAVPKWLIRWVRSGHYFGAMMTLLLHLLRLLPFLFGGHRQLALENLALRQQLAVYKRTIIRPPLRPTDRLFWIGLAKIWTGWRQALVIVTPATVLHWQRRRFRAHWSKLSGSSSGGRPQVQPEITGLIVRIATANPVPSTYSSDRFTPPAAGIRDGVHLRVALPPPCPGSAAAHSETRVRL